MSSTTNYSSLPSNMTTHTPTTNPLQETFPIKVQLTILSIILLLGLTANGFICLTFARNKSMRSLPNYIILNLAVTDLVLVVDMIIWMVLIVKYTRMSMTTYNLFISIDVFCMASAMLNLGLISIDRYIAVVLPLRYPSLLVKSRIRRYVASVWVFSLVLGVASFGRNFAYGRQKTSYNTIYFTFLAAAIYGLPASSIVFAYSKVFIAARKQLRWITIHMRMQAGVNKRESSKKETRLAFNILIIVLPFITIYGLYFGVTLCEIYSKKCVMMIPAKVSFFVGYLPHIVASIDPVIYIVITKDYRIAVKNLFKSFGHNDQVTPKSIDHRNGHVFHSHGHSEVIKHVTTPISKNANGDFDFHVKYPGKLSFSNIQSDGPSADRTTCDTRL